MKAEAIEPQQDINMVSAFDEYGRCLPLTISAPVHVKTRRYFQIEQPEIDYQASYQRLDQAFNIADKISVEQFEARVKAIVARLAKDDANSGILNGVMVPFILPQAHYEDIGSALESTYLPAVDQAFTAVFPKYSFTNHLSKSLVGQLSPTEGARHEQLIDAMNDDVVVGVYFPCLMEYSVPAAVEQVSQLDETFLLAGGFDTAAAFVSAPGLLLRKDGYPPLLWLSGLSSVEDNVGYHFEAYGYDLTFNRRVHLGHVAEYWTSGLTVLG